MVTRGTNAHIATRETDDDGHFEVDVPKGRPFQITFYLDAKTVPAMEELSGGDQDRHQMSVALMRKDDYQEQARKELVPPLEVKLNYILRFLPGDTDAARVISEMRQNL
jgi:hypothetical protein